MSDKIPKSTPLKRLLSFLQDMAIYGGIAILLLLIVVGFPLGLLMLLDYLGWMPFTLGWAIGFVAIWIAIVGAIGWVLYRRWLVRSSKASYSILLNETIGSSIDIKIDPELRKFREMMILGEIDDSANIPRHLRIGFIEIDPPETATDDDVMPNTQPLIRGKTYHLRIDISTKLSSSNITNPVPIPSRALKRIYEGTPLEVVAFSEDFKLVQTGEYSSTQSLYLRKDKTSTFIYIRLTAPDQPGLARLEVAVFYRNALLQWLETTARVQSTEGQEDTFSPLVGIVPFLTELSNLDIKTISQMATLSEDQIKPIAQQLGLSSEQVDKWRQEANRFANLGNETRVIYTISPNLVDFEILESPTVSILFDSTKGKVEVKGSRQSPPPADLAPNLNCLLQTFRKMMATINRPEDNNYPFQPENKGDPKDLPAHLLSMADMGRTLYNVVFLNTLIRDYLRAELNETSLIEIALASSQNIVPWGALYDLPLAEDFEAKIMGVERQVCTLWAEKSHQKPIDPESDQSECKLDYKTCIAAKDCPRQRREHESEKDYAARTELTVCIYGFWGFKHRLQLPPGTRKVQDDRDNNVQKKRADEEALRRFIPVSDKPTVGIIANNTIRYYPIPHLKNLSMIKTGSMRPEIKCADTLKDIKGILTDESLHLVYFYCHGEIKDNLPSLIVGNNDIPLTVNTFSSIWWPNSPLVFINGCETVTYSPDMFTDLVLQFRGLNASGVIGTEIEVFPMLARWFGEEFIKRFLDSEPVGQIMLDLRLELLQRYNPLGLIYTNYSLAGLQLLDEAYINVYRRRAIRRVNPSTIIVE